MMDWFNDNYNNLYTDFMSGLSNDNLVSDSYNRFTALARGYFNNSTCSKHMLNYLFDYFLGWRWIPREDNTTGVPGFSDPYYMTCSEASDSMAMRLYQYYQCMHQEMPIDLQNILADNDLTWNPDDYTYYTMTPQGAALWNQIDMEYEYNRSPKDCNGTNRTGNIKWPGTLEHWLIMIDYITKNPTGEIEFQIPNSSSQMNGNRGYADIADKTKGFIFEIKPYTAEAQGIQEANIYVNAARTYCPNYPPWQLGMGYQQMSFKTPKGAFLANQNSPGVIVYQYGIDPRTIPLPAPIGSTAYQKLERLLKKLANNLKGKNINVPQPDYAKALDDFFKEPSNREIIPYLKSVSIGIIIGSIIEDFVTEGVGIADDWESFTLAWDIYKFATRI